MAIKQHSTKGFTMYKSILAIVVLSVMAMAEDKMIDVPKNDVVDKVVDAAKEIGETISNTKINGTTVNEHTENALDSFNQKFLEMVDTMKAKAATGLDSAKQKIAPKPEQPETTGIQI
jgi:hypothetical protein